MDDTRVYLAIRDHAQKGRYDGIQVDWGAFAIKVNGPELIEILQDAVGRTSIQADDNLITKYISYAKFLGSDQYIAFLSVEL